MKTLEQKIVEVRRLALMLREPALMLREPDENTPKAWQKALDEVTSVENALRAVRITVRARLNSQRKIHCAHPEDQRRLRYGQITQHADGSETRETYGECRRCGALHLPAPSAEGGDF